MKDWIKRHNRIVVAMLLFVVTYAILCSISANYINFDNSKRYRANSTSHYEREAYRTQNEYNVKVARFYFIQLPLGAVVPALLYLLSAFIVMVRRGEGTVKDHNQITSVTNNNDEFSTKDDDIEMIIANYTQKKQQLIREWEEAHPHPQYQNGETLDKYSERINRWKEEQKKLQKDIEHADELKTKIQGKRAEWSKVNNAFLARQSQGALGPQLDAAYQKKLRNIESDIEDLKSQMRIVWYAMNKQL